MPSAAPYLLSLCKAVENSDFSFGVVSRLGTQSSTFQVDAAKLIHSIVEYSPASGSVALEFLFEFQKIRGIYDLGMSPSSGSAHSFPNLFPCIVDKVVRFQSSLQPEQWAEEILVFLREREPDEVKADLKPTLDLATEYLNHLLFASMFQPSLIDLYLMPVRLARNPGGKKTPQESARPTPDIVRLRSIKELLDDATINRKQSALKTLVCEFLR